MGSLITKVQGPSSERSCSVCHGEKTVMVDDASSGRLVRKAVACPACGGTGKSVLITKQ